MKDMDTGRPLVLELETRTLHPRILLFSLFTMGGFTWQVGLEAVSSRLPGETPMRERIH